MRNKIFPLLALSLAFTASACTTLVTAPPEKIPLSEIVSKPDMYVGKKFISSGIFYLAFENERICVDREKNNCISYVPSSEMQIHREAYNRVFLSFAGELYIRKNGNALCARNCIAPIVEISKIGLPKDILEANNETFPVRSDPEGTAQSSIIEDKESLFALAIQFQSGSRNIDSAKVGRAVERQANKRMNWIISILKKGKLTTKSKNGNIFLAQLRDDLDQEKLSSDAIICYCISETCAVKNIQPIVFDQSVSDQLICIPAIRKDQLWTIDYNFFIE